MPGVLTHTASEAFIHVLLLLDKSSVNTNELLPPPTAGGGVQTLKYFNNESACCFCAFGLSTGRLKLALSSIFQFIVEECYNRRHHRNENNCDYHDAEVIFYEFDISKKIANAEKERYP